MFCDIPDQVARSLKLGACARYDGAPPDDHRRLYSLEGHSARGRFLFHCRPELIPLLIRDIEAAAAKSEFSKFRELCVEAVGSLEVGLQKPDAPSDRSYITPARLPDGTWANGA